MACTALAAVVFAGTFSCGPERDFEDAEDSGGDTAAAGAGGTDDTTDGNTGETDGGGNTNAGGASAMGGQTSTGDPDSCTSDEDCSVSGECRISYEDKDGDAYGNPDVRTGRCDGSIPAGFTALAGDCCDDGGDLETAALLNPGQETYFDSPANICGIDWDYDCSGGVEYGGYTCSNSDEACADEENRNYDTTVATSTSYVTGCLTGTTCDDECEEAYTDLAKADCGTWYALIGCSCAGGCGQGGCTSCTSVGGTSRRVVECR